MYNVIRSRNRQDAAYNILIFLIHLTVMTFILRYLWNGTLVKYISVLKPVDSLFHTFMLALALSIFKC